MSAAAKRKELERAPMQLVADKREYLAGLLVGGNCALSLGRAVNSMEGYVRVVVQYPTCFQEAAIDPQDPKVELLSPEEAHRLFEEFKTAGAI